MNKIEIMKHYLKTKYLRKFKTRKQLEHYQKIQMKRHIAYVFKHSAFYREFYQAETTQIDDNWEQLPIISKHEMMENFNTLNTANINKDQAYQLALEAEKTRDFSAKLNGISIGLSSGTSGNRGIFLISDKESAKWVGTVLAKLLPGHIFERHKIAFFLRANNNLYSSTENGRITFHYFDLLDESTSHQEKLNDLQPTIIIGPPSFLRLLAEWQEQKIIHVTPSKIVSVAEVLEDLDKYYIEKIYNQMLHQVYQSTEGFLAATCSHGTLHMNEDIVMIHKEYLDEAKGIFVPIISDFTRTTQPIIRYRLNDILIESKTSCPCGSPFLALDRIDGRCDDLFFGLKNTSAEICTLFPDFIRRAIMFASDKIVEYKITQVDMLKINIKLKVSGQLEEVKEDVRAEMVKLWESSELIIPSFSFFTYDLKPSDKKLKRIESLIKENHHGQNV